MINYHFDPFLLVQSSQNRKKSYTWSQLFLYTGLLPTKILNLQKNQSQVDPLWLLTQSYKNYANSDLFLKYYFSPEIFVPYHNSYGMTSRFIDLHTKPMYFKFVTQTEWYERQRFICRIIDYLYLIPGIHKIYLVGSAQLEISTQTSDLDLAVQCHKHWVLPARIVLKFILKLSKTDVHPLFLELLAGFYKFTNQNLKASQIQAKIFKFQKPSRIKIDAGLFFEDKNQLWNYFEKTERNIWIYDMALIPSNYFAFTDYKNETSLCYLPHPFSRIKKFIFNLLRYLLYFPGLLIYPLSMLQLIWFKLRKVENKFLVADFDFCCFYPRYPIFRFLTKLKP
jgi:hypothetical protein